MEDGLHGSLGHPVLFHAVAGNSVANAHVQTLPLGTEVDHAEVFRMKRDDATFNLVGNVRAVVLANLI
jgi:hypothetical protein